MKHGQGGINMAEAVLMGVVCGRLLQLLLPVGDCSAVQARAGHFTVRSNPIRSKLIQNARNEKINSLF